MQDPHKIPKIYLDLINQIFEIEKKVAQLEQPNSISRNLNRLKDLIENDLPFSVNGSHAGLIYHNPLGEKFNETRVDCEASIAGDSTEDLEIVEVIRPLVRLKSGGHNFIVQKAVVVAESKK